MIYLILNILMLISSFFIFFSENSVHSIIFLILTFLNASAICFIFGADFLGLILIIIYIGAIAILFLFVVMLLNVKIQQIGFIKYLPIVMTCSLIFLVQLYLFFESSYLNFDFLIFNSNFFESLTTEFYLSQILFNNFLICFLLAGIVLLVGMLGAIVLTFNFNARKNRELSYRQLSRNCDNFVCIKPNA